VYISLLINEYLNFAQVAYFLREYEHVVRIGILSEMLLYVSDVKSFYGLIAIEPNGLNMAKFPFR
jgi:hypothetical protein